MMGWVIRAYMTHGGRVGNKEAYKGFCLLLLHLESPKRLELLSQHLHILNRCIFELSCPFRYWRVPLPFFSQARIHPFHILVALETYKGERGFRGKLHWQPDKDILEALDASLYKTFQVTVGC